MIYIDIDIVLLKTNLECRGDDGSSVHVCLTSHYKLWETYYYQIYI